MDYLYPIDLKDQQVGVKLLEKYLKGKKWLVNLEIKK